MVQWIIDTVPKDADWSSRRITYEIIAIWFGSVHALSSVCARQVYSPIFAAKLYLQTITYALYDLCVHPEYVGPIREEMERLVTSQNSQNAGKEMPLLDSFLKESTRLTPLEASRTSFSSFRWHATYFNSGRSTTSTEGLYIFRWHTSKERPLDMRSHKGYTAWRGLFPGPKQLQRIPFSECGQTPQWLYESDPARRALQASGHFTELPLLGHWKCCLVGLRSRISVTTHWYIYHSPGRFYASLASKLVLTHIVRNYEVALVDKNAKRSIVWRSYILPSSKTLVTFTPRDN
jgi:hypothetical protein